MYHENIGFRSGHAQEILPERRVECFGFYNSYNWTDYSDTRCTKPKIFKNNESFQATSFDSCSTQHEKTGKDTDHVSTLDGLCSILALILFMCSSYSRAATIHKGSVF